MVSWLITAGVLGAGPGILGAAPAFAETGDALGFDGGSSRPVVGLRQSPGAPPPGINRVARPPRTRSVLPPDPGSDAPILAAVPPRRVAPGPQLGVPADRVPSLPVVHLHDVPAPAIPAAPVATPAPAAPVPATGPLPSAVVRIVPPAPTAPTRPTDVADRQAVPTPLPARMGLPARVAEAALPRIEPVATPGLLALLGLTAVGIFLGCRQARAGFAFNSTGTRYLR